MLKKNRTKILNTFKRLKTIDYFFFLLLIFISGFFMLRFSRKAETIYVDLTFKNKGYARNEIPPKYWETIQIEEGDAGYNSFGNEVAKVVDVEESYWGNGERRYIRIVVELDAIYNSATKNYVYQGNPLLIGNELNLNFSQSDFSGVITNIYKSRDDRFSGWKNANAILQLTVEDVKPWHAEALKNFEINSSDFKVETLDSTISPALKVLETDDGKLVKDKHPINKDVTLTLKLYNVLCRQQICFYRYRVPLAIGAVFYADAGYVYLPTSSIENLEINYLD